jgi:hypothetical protein
MRVATDFAAHLRHAVPQIQRPGTNHHQHSLALTFAPSGLSSVLPNPVHTIWGTLNHTNMLT